MKRAGSKRRQVAAANEQRWPGGWQRYQLRPRGGMGDQLRPRNYAVNDEFGSRCRGSRAWHNRGLRRQWVARLPGGLERVLVAPSFFPVARSLRRRAGSARKPERYQPFESTSWIRQLLDRAGENTRPLRCNQLSPHIGRQLAVIAFA